MSIVTQEDYAGPIGKKLRAEADQLATERQRLQVLANEQFKQGDKKAGHQLLTDSKKLQSQVVGKNAEAAMAVFRFNNDGRGDSLLDLRGLRTDEAVKITTQRLDELQAKAVQTVTTLEIVLEAGHNSQTGKVALKSSTEKLLTSRKIEWKEVGSSSFSAKVNGKGVPVARARPTQTTQHTADKTDERHCCAVM